MEKQVLSTEEWKKTFYTYYDYYVVKRKGGQEFKDWLETTDFFEAPASTRFHGSNKNGLVEHSMEVLFQMSKLVKAYKPEIPYDPGSVALVSLLHDVCKANVYKTEMRNAKQDGKWVQVPYYTFNEDFPFGGHGSKSVYLIQKYIDLTDEEATAINCHMGFSDTNNLNAISSAYEKYPIAWMLHVADEAATYLSKK